MNENRDKKEKTRPIEDLERDFQEHYLKFGCFFPAFHDWFRSSWTIEEIESFCIVQECVFNERDNATATPLLKETREGMAKLNSFLDIFRRSIADLRSRDEFNAKEGRKPLGSMTLIEALGKVPNSIETRLDSYKKQQSKQAKKINELIVENRKLREQLSRR